MIEPALSFPSQVTLSSLVHSHIYILGAAGYSSFLSWWTWGSEGPLTNAGYHDFFGVVSFICFRPEWPWCW